MSGKNDLSTRRALVDVRSVGKVYGKRQVLESVDLRVEPGEVVGLIGPNGAGKSTLIRIISGMSEPTTGMGSVLGESLKGRNGRIPFIGMMIERPAFIETLSARRNLSLLFGIREKPDAAAIDDLLRRVGLDPHDRKPVRTYSLGMRQRLSLAQAIGERPELVILDEPTNGLDPSGIIEMRRMIRGLADQDGMGVLLASHLLSEVEAVCDRVIMLGGGKVRRTFTPNEHTDATVLLEVSSNEDIERVASVVGVTVERRVSELALEVRLSVPMPEAVRELVAAGVSIEGIQRSRERLERMYLEAVQSA